MDVLISQYQSENSVTANAQEAEYLRARLMNWQNTPFAAWKNFRAGDRVAPFGLVDVRQVAPRVRVLDAPSWSAPKQRFYVRPEVAGRLEHAARLLPEEYSLGFWEGFRPLVVQRALWETGLALLRESNPGLHRRELEASLESYVARPTPNAPHHLGSAVDVAILDRAGRVLRDTAALGVLSQSLLSAGLSNYEPEWWHWSYDGEITDAQEWEYLQ